MKNILVTGGSGFIGSHTCLTLLKKGYNLTIIDSNINSSFKSIERIIQIGKIENLDFSKNINLFHCDLGDQKLLDKIFSTSLKNNLRISAVIHFAGLKAVHESVINPIKYWENNVNGSINLFKVMDRYDCKNIVFSSSATVYGNIENDLISENNNLCPTNPYGHTKLAIENILNDIFRSSKLKWRIAILRYFNPIGAHHSGLIGENPLAKPNNLFPYICNVAGGHLEKLSIYGNNWNTPDGTCIRDFIHIMDLADAHLAALNYLLNNEGQIIHLNIGTGKGTSVLELVNLFMEVNNCALPIFFTNRRSGDVARLVADNRLALKKLNWKPKRDIQDMCKDGWNWQRKNPKGY
tara:strand:- start:845 stop:1897 length:1053 start_codon:yes stop_codon:yes gene_type:complete